jgi:hypothetical protein
MGSGGAIADFNNDGRQDLLLLSGALTAGSSSNACYIQQPDRGFVDESARRGLSLQSAWQSAAVGDINNDGWVDLCLAGFDRTAILLNRSGTFEDITASSAVTNAAWCTSAVFCDIDRDGYLDLILGNYLEYSSAQECASPSGRPDFCGPGHFPGCSARVFRNLTGTAQDSPVFEEISRTSRIGLRPGKTLGIYAGDFNSDFWPDLFFANDSQPNALYINQQNATFEEEGMMRGLAVNALGAVEANMGIAAGDVDNDGLTDVLVTHLDTERHRLWRQHSPGNFVDITHESGLAQREAVGTGFGAVFADFDNDGDNDLAVAHGAVSRSDRSLEPAEDASFWTPWEQTNALFGNQGGVFRSVCKENPAFCRVPGVFRTLLCGDLDDDGALDLVACRIDSPPLILTNSVTTPGHWVRFRVFDPRLKRDDYGARLSLLNKNTGIRQVRSASPCSSYAGCHDPRVHFGLGDSPLVSEVEVCWFDGVVETFPVPRIDCDIQLSRRDDRPIASQAVVKP